MIKPQWQRWSIEKRAKNAIVTGKDYVKWDRRLREGVVFAERVVRHKNFRKLTHRQQAEARSYLVLFNGGGIDNEEVDRMFWELGQMLKEMEAMDKISPFKNVRKSAHGREFTDKEAKKIGDIIGIDWDEIPLDEFRMGLSVELEHGIHDTQTNVTNDDLVDTGKIALAHLKEGKDYYTRLARMEKEMKKKIVKAVVDMLLEKASKKPKETRTKKTAKPRAKGKAKKPELRTPKPSSSGRGVPFKPAHKYTENVHERKPESLKRSIKEYLVGSVEGFLIKAMEDKVGGLMEHIESYGQKAPESITYTYETSRDGEVLDGTHMHVRYEGEKHPKVIDISDVKGPALHEELKRRYPNTKFNCHGPSNHPYYTAEHSRIGSGAKLPKL